MFRNDTGLCPISLKEIAHIHNLALKFMAEGKFGIQFWKSNPIVTAIKPKYMEYLKGIDHRLKVLRETPRIEPDRGDNTFVTKDCIQNYLIAKLYKDQIRPDIPIELAMDENLCKLYETCSREFQQKMDVHDKSNMQALVSLAVMELQFMHGCDVEWKLPADAGNSASQALSPAADGDDGEEARADDANASDASADDGEDDSFQFTTIDMLDVYKYSKWEELDYPDPTTFVARRESYALAILFFLNEELGEKFPKLNGQIHAGWKHTFKTPVTMDQLMDRPDGIDTMFTEDEETWFTQTMQFYISTMDEEQLEDLGITSEHLKLLKLPEPSQKVGIIPHSFHCSTYTLCFHCGGMRLK